ncbi:MAG TPA: AAA family ATPase, partial [Candidatus Methylomirabilis sp.]|nr:AAA family ATPase [Candidatus Methylomirabilis sp.]
MLQELFKADVRLATLTGPPGIGKTRLALEVAAALENRFRGGVAFVDLAPIRDPALVLPVVLRSLGIEDAPDRPILPRLRQALHGRDVLLLLDNLEQVIAAGEEIGEVIASCPGVRILATSREPLHLSWEREIPVPPLETAQSTDPAAVALFVERARAVEPDFTPRGEDLQVVREVCIRLDGLPLAIEMAAAWIKALPPREILNRLAERFDLLTALGPAVPDRHRTLKNAIAWSYDLLSPAEQRVFRTLGIFKSGFTPDAAEAACGADEPSNVLLAIASLVDKSLVHRDVPAADGSARFRLLESLREFALETLTKTGESDDTHARHAAFFAQYASAAAPELRGASQKIWFDRLDRSYPDLQSSLEFCLTRGDPLVGLRLVWALFWFWDVRGHWREGLEWLTRALAAATAAPPADKARGLLATGHLAFHVGEYGQARVLLEESIGLLRSLGLRRDLGEALLFLGVLLRRQSEYRAAEPVQDESLELFTEARDEWGMLFALSELTRLARLMGNPERAWSVGRRALAFAKETGQQREIANALEDLAVV